MQWMKDKQKIEYIFAILAMAVIPLLVCMIVCLRDGIMLKDIYLANSKWNDEVFYYKMIEAVVEHNHPLGYFGYNESTANVGRFGSWSPVLLIFYVVYGKIFGWTMLSPVYCNIALMSIAMAIFAYLARPTKQQILFVFLLYSTCTIITRYIFSNMPEISVYALLIIYLGISIRMLRKLQEKYKFSYIISLNLLTLLLVLMRPYWVLLTIVPGGYWYYKKSKKLSFLGEGIWSFCCIGLYFFISQNYCAEYCFDIINWKWFELLISDPFKGIYNILYMFFSSIWSVLQEIGDGLVKGSVTGGIYAIYFMMIIYFIYMIHQDQGDEKVTNVVMHYFLFYFCMMLLAIIYLYNIEVGSRHVIGFLVIFSFSMPFAKRTIKQCAMFIAAFVWIFCIMAIEEDTYKIPVYTKEKEIALQKGEQELAQKELIDQDSDEPWDNTIIWLFSDENLIDFSYLYALPGGMGIELCFKDYVIDNFSKLQPKYILTNIGEEVDLLCEQEGKILLTEYGNVHIWKLR